MAWPSTASTPSDIDWQDAASAAHANTEAVRTDGMGPPLFPGPAGAAATMPSPARPGQTPRLLAARLRLLRRRRLRQARDAPHDARAREGHRLGPALALRVVNRPDV